MIKYPILKAGSTIGVTAPSSGVQPELHDLLHLASDRLKEKGFNVVFGDTVWTQEKAKSSSAAQRAEEFNEMMGNDSIDLITPPWGGELLIEMLEGIDFNSITDKWVLGYSDVSALLLAMTLKTGVATAHGTNFVDLRGESWDETTAFWLSVLTTNEGATVLQRSSTNYQKEWQHANPTPWVFHLTEETEWKTVSNKKVKLQGRLLGGCIDIIRHLIGTPFGDVRRFQKHMILGEPVLWYFENCELNTTDLKRSLVQMKYAGWFDHCSGIMFGRSSANHPVEDYTVLDVYKDLSDEFGIPIVYDIDCGHQPPQITLINGAYAEVEVDDGKGIVAQYFRP